MRASRPSRDAAGPGADERPRAREARSGLAVRLDERKERHAGRGRLYRIGFAVAGLVVLAAGLAMLVLPGPGLLVTALALGMLALEFRWAERVLLRGARLGGDGRDRLLGLRRLRRGRSVR